MKIAVFGAGGVGGYFGGRLAQAGHDVTFIARGKHLGAIKNGGLRVESINGDFIIPQAKATDDPSGIGEMDLVLVSVKAWQVLDAAHAIKPMIGGTSTVLPLENGIEAAAELAVVLGSQHIVGGLCKIISYIGEPGLIRHVGAKPYIAVGELDGSDSPRVGEICDAFDSAGVSIEKMDNIQAAIWEKFLFIASWSGVGAVTRAPVGAIRTYQPTRELLARSMKEITRLAIAQGVVLPDDVIEKNVNFIDSLPPESTTSMQRDIQDGRPSELEAQCGAVVRLGEQHNIATPVNSFIYHSLSLMERVVRSSC